MTLVEFCNLICLPLLMLSAVLAFVRLVWGPSHADRVVALDLLTSVAIAVVAVHAVSSGEPFYLSVALVVALISFVSVVYLAEHLRRRGEINGRHH